MPGGETNVGGVWRADCKSQEVEAWCFLQKKFWNVGGEVNYIISTEYGGFGAMEAQSGVEGELKGNNMNLGDRRGNRVNEGQ